MSNIEFRTIVKNQFPSREEQEAAAVSELKSFLREGAPQGVSLEIEFTDRYLTLLGACGFDESRAAELFDDCVNELETYG